MNPGISNISHISKTKYVINNGLNRLFTLEMRGEMLTESSHEQHSKRGRQKINIFYVFEKARYGACMGLYSLFTLEMGGDHGYSIPEHRKHSKHSN